MKCYCILIVCCIIYPSYAQNIHFEGLKRTQSSYLLRLIDWQSVSVKDSLAAQEAAQRIRNTRLFSEVDAKIIVTEADTSVLFDCKEVRAFLSILEFGVTQGNKWFDLVLLDENG